MPLKRRRTDLYRRSRHHALYRSLRSLRPRHGSAGLVGSMATGKGRRIRTGRRRTHRAMLGRAMVVFSSPVAVVRYRACVAREPPASLVQRAIAEWPSYQLVRGQ